MSEKNLRELYFKSFAEKVEVEYDVARGHFKLFGSTHEGYAVILEELDELWELIKKNGDKREMQKELIQICAMCWAFYHELT